MMYLQVTIFCLENSIYVRILQVQKLTKSKMVVITKNKDIVPIRHGYPKNVMKYNQYAYYALYNAPF
jgi:hypothetical protein